MKKVINNSEREVKRVACYIRVSHDEQVRHGLSLEAQRKSLIDYAEKHGYKIVDFYVDEGLTARKTLRKRVAFNRMIRDVKNDKIDLIIFIKLDRWFRNVSDYYKTMEILENHNCTWVATEEDYDLTTSTGRLNLNIRLSMAQNESDQTSDRIHYVFENRRREGYVTSGGTPFGYKIENKKYVVNEKNAEIVRDLFDYFVKCGSASETLEYYRNTYGKLAYKTLKRYLRNTAYIGEYRTDKGELLENYTPAIIDKDLFKQAQILLDKNIRVHKATYNREDFIFNGLLYCNECGKRLTINPRLKTLATKEKRLYKYYKCYKVSQLDCSNKKLGIEEKIEKHLLDNLEKEAKNYIADNKLKGTIQTKRPVDNTAKIQSKLRNLRELYIENDIDKAEYDERKAILQNELNANIEELSKVDVPKDLSKLEELINSDFLTLYNSLNNKNKRRFWGSFIDKIYIQDGNVAKIIFL